MTSPERPLTIAQLIETDGPGGAEMVLFELSRELRRRGHRVVALGPAGGEGWLSGRFEADGFEHRKFRVRRALDPLFLADLVGQLRALGVDVVHSHEFTCAVYGAAATRWLGIPQVVTLHGNEEVTAVWRRRAALRWCFRHSDASTAVSEVTRNDMALRLGIPPQSMEVVPNGVATPEGDRARVRTELELDDDDLLLLAVGNLYFRKGHRVLLEALHQLTTFQKPRSVHVAVAGRGDERAVLEARAAELGLADRLHLLGVRDDIPDLLAAADVYVMPSYWEGMPLALLEAMLAGKACVVSEVGGIPEVIPSEEFGLLVPPGEPAPLAAALRRVVEDPELRARLAGAARERARAHYTLPVMTDAYEALYRAALTSR